jgi:hypothetical protein
MIKKIHIGFFTSLLIGAVPGLVKAVAVPSEFLENEGPVGHETLYGFIVFVFIAGIGFGIWLQKKLSQH